MTFDELQALSVRLVDTLWNFELPGYPDIAPAFGSQLYKLRLELQLARLLLAEKGSNLVLQVTLKVLLLLRPLKNPFLLT